MAARTRTRSKAKLGTGRRFGTLQRQLRRRGARTPGALAAWIGRRKYGARRMAKLSARGRSRAARRR